MHNVFFQACVSLNKISILLLYRRLFAVNKPFYTLLYALCGVIGAYFLVAIFGIIFAYNPVHAQWMQWIPHTNIDFKQFLLSIGIVNALLDIIVLLVPQRSVWSLQLTWQRRLLVSLVFMLGGW